MSLEQAVTEQELTEKAVAPRVTDDQVEAFIVSEHYFTGADGVLGAATPAIRPLLTAQNDPPVLALLTFCVLVLANGFTVHGYSACADAKNFDPEIGRRIARANAKAQVWSHLGFALRTKLDLIEKGTPPSTVGMRTYVGQKAVHARPMTRSEWCMFRGWDLPANEDGTDEGYLIEYADGGEPNIPAVGDYPGFAGYVTWSPKDVFDRAYGQPLR